MALKVTLLPRLMRERRQVINQVMTMVLTGTLSVGCTCTVVSEVRVVHPRRLTFSRSLENGMPESLAKANICRDAPAMQVTILQNCMTRMTEAMTVVPGTEPVAV